MRSLLIATVAVSFLLSGAVDAKRPKWDKLDGYTFEQYQKDFVKSYSDAHELAMRKKIFTQRVMSVQAHNADKTMSYKQGVNHMSDWTEEERARLLGNRPAMKAAHKGHHEVRVPRAGPLPASVDYRTASPAILTAVKDQGQCGSCWAHAATEEIESMWAIQTGELYVLSQQQINSCTPNPKECGGNGGCGGAIAELAWDYVVAAGGIAQEWTYPYTSYFGDSHFDSCANNSARAKKPVNLTGYTATKSNDDNSVLEALANAGPLAVSVDASHWYEYEGGIYDGCDYAKNISMDHAVQLVGYGHDFSNGMNYWIVRNSWSPAWGEEGFIRLHRHQVQTCGWNVHNQDGGGCKGGPETIKACGMCGIAWDAIYPNVGVN